jgi:aldehyde dehydrogenase (NAD+)
MRRIEQLYIDGGFVKPHGTEVAELINPTTEAVIATLILADAEDTRRAIAAAKAALPSFAKSTKEERRTYRDAETLKRSCFGPDR